MTRHTVKNLVDDLKGLGIVRGDIVLLRAALRPMGEVEGRSSTAIIQALLKVIGPQGTMFSLAFNPLSLFPRIKKCPSVTLHSTPNSGGLAVAMVSWPGAIRSLHPAFSWVGIGQHSQEILADHDENATCFQPVEKLLQYDAKMILIGCANSSPGFSTVHLAQEQLGLATRSVISGLRGLFYERGGKIKLYRQIDVPTCSMGFGNFYPDYDNDNKLTPGRVGDAHSLSIRARDAFDIEYNILKRDPTYALCDNKYCICCRGTLFYNKRDMPGFYLFNAFTAFRSMKK